MHRLEHISDKMIRNYSTIFVDDCDDLEWCTCEGKNILSFHNINISIISLDTLIKLFNEVRDLLIWHSYRKGNFKSNFPVQYFPTWNTFRSYQASKWKECDVNYTLC